MDLRPLAGTHICQFINRNGLTHLDFCLCVVLFWILHRVGVVSLSSFGYQHGFQVLGIVQVLGEALH